MAETNVKEQKSQGPKFEFQIQGSTNNCTLFVSYKPNKIVTFYVGNQPGIPLDRKVADGNNKLTVRTNEVGLGILRDVNLEQIMDLSNFNSISALVASDYKRSEPISLPLPSPDDEMARQGKQIKVRPDKNPIESFNNLFTIEVQAYDESGKIPTKQNIIFEWGAPVLIVYANGEPRRGYEQAKRFVYETNDKGYCKMYFRLVAMVTVTVGIRIAGAFERIERTCRLV